LQQYNLLTGCFYFARDDKIPLHKRFITAGAALRGAWNFCEGETPMKVSGTFQPGFPGI
jgi:hypothetical protein